MNSMFRKNRLKKKENGDIVGTILVIGGFASVLLLMMHFITGSLAYSQDAENRVAARAVMEQIVEKAESLKVENGGKSSQLTLVQEGMTENGTQNIVVSYAGKFANVQQPVKGIEFRSVSNDNNSYTIYATNPKKSENDRSKAQEPFTFLTYSSSTNEFVESENPSDYDKSVGKKSYN